MFDGEELVGIVDFEEVCYGPLMIDVGMVTIEPMLTDVFLTIVLQTILGCCFPRNNKLDLGLMQAFLNAYDAKRPMNPSERAKLVPFIQYAALTIAFWRFRSVHA